MDWTLSNLAIHVATGAVGASAAAAAIREHRFGHLGHATAGTMGGALSGFFLQRTAVTMVTASGSLNPVSSVENIVLQALTGFCAGAIAMMMAGYGIHLIAEHRGRQGLEMTANERSGRRGDSGN